MMALSLGATNLFERLFKAIAQGATHSLWFRLSTLSLSLVINMAIAFGLLTLLPRIHVTWKRLFGPLLTVAIAITALNELGNILLRAAENNPAYALVATSVGLLIYLYTFNQIVLWATSWAATAHDGKCSIWHGDDLGNTTRSRTTRTAKLSYRSARGNDVPMGAIVTLELADDAPQHNLPWIITFGPLDDDEDWEPVVCGPYERPHALAIAHNMTEDTDLMAVVEPLLPAVSIDEIRAQIVKAQEEAESGSTSRTTTWIPTTTTRLRTTISRSTNTFTSTRPASPTSKRRSHESPHACPWAEAEFDPKG
jgi:hypothetical protein